MNLSAQTRVVCGATVRKANNGKSRGTCTRLKGHGFGQHGSGTCYGCAVVLITTNAKPSNVIKGSGLCRDCTAKWRRNACGMNPRNYQKLGKAHTFPCGCSGILPIKWEYSNGFVRRAYGSGKFGCRVSSILSGSQASARRNGNKPIPKNTPHSIIRDLMTKPNCERCGERLHWTVTLGSRAPHLHHNHETGEIYGFTHPVCNPQATANEIEKLKRIIKEYGTSIYQF